MSGIVEVGVRRNKGAGGVQSHIVEQAGHGCDWQAPCKGSAMPCKGCLTVGVVSKLVRRVLVRFVVGLVLGESDPLRRSWGRRVSRGVERPLGVRGPKWWARRGS